MTLCTSSSNLSIRRKISNGSIVCATHVMPLATFDIPADSWPGKDISASPGNNRLPRPRGLVQSPTATSSKNTAQILKKWFSLLPGSFSCWLRWTGQFFQFLWNWPTSSMPKFWNIFCRFLGPLEPHQDNERWKWNGFQCWKWWSEKFGVILKFYTF